MTGSAAVRSVRRLAAAAAAAAVAAGVLTWGAPAGPAAAAAVPAGFVLSGSGWGHGVGMSQYGARGQAAAGRTAEQILRHYYSGTAVETRDDDRLIRVQVLGGVGAATARTSRVGSGGGTFQVIAGSVRVDGRLGDSVRFTPASAGRITATVSFADGSPARAVTTGRALMHWDGTSVRRGAATVVDVAGAGGRYRHGRLEVTSVGGRVNVVNRLAMGDEYLYGVAEMPSSWQHEALRAQAVAARTYAMRRLDAGTDAACDCTVYDEVRSQKFTGWSKESETIGSTAYGARWVAAVDASDGLVATYRGALIDALYFSSSGGRTVNSEDYFGGRYPYARSVSDPWSTSSANPNATWRTTVSQAAVARAFGLPDVASLDLADRNSGGGVAVAVATSSSGATRSLTGQKLRTALGLKSTWLRRPVDRFAGADRYATAAAVARTVAPYSRTAVLVSGEDGHLVDGLVAAPLAASLDAPVLLVRQGSLPGAVQAELDRRRVNRVVVVGGEPAVGDAVASHLARDGIAVERIAGRDRYATAAAVARRAGAPGRQAVLASGRDASLADALVAAGPSAATRRPVLLVRPDAVPAHTAAALSALGVSRSICVGSTAVLSESVRRDLPSCTRAGGRDRYETAVAVVEAFGAAVSADTAVIVSGDDRNLVDALAAGTLARPTLLVRPTGAPGVVTRLLQRTGGVATLDVVGGSPAVPDAVVQQLRDA